jgi:CRP-like cAMP-binding protein
VWIEIAFPLHHMPVLQAYAQDLTVSHCSGAIKRVLFYQLHSAPALLFHGHRRYLVIGDSKMPDHARLPALRSQVRNRILLSLPEHEFQRIFRHLAFVELRQGQVLYNSDNWIEYAYFMNSGMTSSLSVTSEGQTVEDGTVGQEGLMGGPAALGESQIFCSGIVEIPGNAMRIRVQVLRYEFQHNTGFSRLLLNYINDLRLQLNQSDKCNVLHTVEQRVCRLLLMSQDCARSKSYPFTYKFFSHIVGATRATVSASIGALDEAGLIYCRRNRIRVLNRKEIQHRACSCYLNSAHKYGRSASLRDNNAALPHRAISGAAEIGV